MKYAKKKNRYQIVLFVCLIVFLIFILVPIYWTVILSFDREATTSLPDFSLFPHKFSMFNYKVANKLLNIPRYFMNTIFVTVVNTFISVFAAVTCGYAFAKGKFIFKSFWFYFMLAVMMIPFESRMIPLYIQYKNWGMLNTYWPLMINSIVYVYGIFFARQNIAALPDSLRESAYIDGANEWKIYFSIILPLSTSLVATLSILQVIANWNAYLWPLVIIRDSKKQMLSVGVALFNSQESTIYYGPRMAVAVISAIPLTVLFLFLQKYIVRSIAVSGIKQ